MPRGQRGVVDLPPGPANDLVELFRRIAERNGLTRAAIAVKSGLSRSYVGELLNGRKVPTSATAGNLATAMAGSREEVVLARKLAGRLREIQQYERSKQTRPSGAGPDADLWDVCVAFTLALDSAHNGLRLRMRHNVDDESATAADLVVHESGLYAQRERLLLCASPELARSGEVVFLSLVNIRNAVRLGACIDGPEYRELYRRYAKALWLFRGAVREEFGKAPLAPQLLMRQDWSDRD